MTPPSLTVQIVLWLQMDAFVGRVAALGTVQRNCASAQLPDACAEWFESFAQVSFCPGEGCHARP